MDEILKKDILEYARKSGCDKSEIINGSLFATFNIKLSHNLAQVMANNLKAVLQMSFDAHQPNDTIVKISHTHENEYAYDFTPGPGYKSIS